MARARPRVPCWRGSGQFENQATERAIAQCPSGVQRRASGRAQLARGRQSRCCSRIDVLSATSEDSIVNGLLSFIRRMSTPRKLAVLVAAVVVAMLTIH